MKVIGKYQIKGLLGKGGMGKVYKAMLPAVEKMVALKLLTPHEHMQQLLGSEMIHALFHDEARVLANISHPHLASLLDFDYDQAGRPFFVMQYLCMNIGNLIGESYEVEKSTRRLPPERAARYMDQILSGLDRLHYAGIIHRDIKPYNILLTDDDRVKIIDLGLSRLRGELRTLPDTFKIGTPFYAPPEQEARPDKVDERADLFSAGVMMWRMLTGMLPPESGAPPLPSQINPLLGTGWDEVLLKGIATDVAHRFQSCDQMRHAVDETLRNWQQTLAHTCRLVPASPYDGQVGRQKKPRQNPAKVSRAESRAFFGLDEWSRPILQRTGTYQAQTAQTVLDTAHGLIWQQSGSAYPMDWQSAHGFIRELNRKMPAGGVRWRLPTVAELTGLLQPKTVLGDYCQPTVFAPQKNRLWSADKKSFTAAWYVDSDLGFVDSQDMTCRFYVRAVADA